MISDRRAIFPNLTIVPLSFRARQLQFSRYDRLREVPFTDKIWNYVDIMNVAILKERQSVAQTWLFFPKTGDNFAEDVATPNLGRVHESGRARVRVNR